MWFSKIFVLFMFVFFLSGISIGTIFAAPSPPTAVVFGNNVTSVFDEGNFSVNWTSGGGDEVNYTIYIFADNILFATAGNDSETGYLFNNHTEANYTFIIEAVNATLVGVNSSNISIYVDRTAPTIALPVYANGTAKQNSSMLTLNISVSDTSSGLTGSRCIVDVNGTNESLAVSSGWCNSTNFNLTGLSDGNHTIKVYVNDTVNILGINDSFVVFLDSTNPLATADCSPSSAIKGSIIECTCSGSDAASGVSSKSDDQSITKNSAGAFDFSCTVTDNAGNSNTDTFTYSFTGSGVSSSSGGGSSSSKSNIFTKITPGNVSIVKNFDKGTGIKQIEITVKNTTQNVKVTVTKYGDKPAEVSTSKSGKVFQYIHIDTQNLLGSLDSAKITFRVNKTWLLDNGLAKEDVVVSKFNESNNEWNDLDTIYSESDDDYDYYIVNLNSFSYFAISAKSVVSSGSGQDSTTTSSGGGSENSQKNGFNWVVFFIVLVVLAMVVLFGKNKINSSFTKQ